MRKYLIGLCSFAVSTPAALLFYWYGENLPGLLRLAGWGVVGVAAGLLLGRLFGPRDYFAVGIGAFIGALLLWTPVVVVTYGFALLGVPFLVAYAATVALGAKYSAGRR
jgi:hypothetical protein